MYSAAASRSSQAGSLHTTSRAIGTCDEPPLRAGSFAPVRRLREHAGSSGARRGGTGCPRATRRRVGCRVARVLRPWQSSRRPPRNHCNPSASSGQSVCRDVPGRVRLLRWHGRDVSPERTRTTDPGHEALERRRHQSRYGVTHEHVPASPAAPKKGVRQERTMRRRDTPPRRSVDAEGHNAEREVPSIDGDEAQDVLGVGLSALWIGQGGLADAEHSRGNVRPVPTLFWKTCTLMRVNRGVSNHFTSQQDDGRMLRLVVADEWNASAEQRRRFAEGSRRVIGDLEEPTQKQREVVIESDFYLLGVRALATRLWERKPLA